MVQRADVIAAFRAYRLNYGNSFVIDATELEDDTFYITARFSPPFDIDATQIAILRKYTWSPANAKVIEYLTSDEDTTLLPARVPVRTLASVPKPFLRMIHAWEKQHWQQLTANAIIIDLSTSVDDHIDTQPLPELPEATRKGSQRAQELGAEQYGKWLAWHEDWEYVFYTEVEANEYVADKGGQVFAIRGILEPPVMLSSYCYRR
eukprot:TRINITY_DN27930_c0_g1_i1.p1 TRINITY_DN27930_c0_g1~~TRINITY_DN27930_c0_g1_i1.p1  ORF type:complete len:206 (+),score=24.57 TRINITY_DN27930_c0_g1_i1:367-984(+)